MLFTCRARAPRIDIVRVRAVRCVLHDYFANECILCGCKPAPMANMQYNTTCKGDKRHIAYRVGRRLWNALCTSPPKRNMNAYGTHCNAQCHCAFIIKTRAIAMARSNNHQMARASTLQYIAARAHGEMVIESDRRYLDYRTSFLFIYTHILMEPFSFSKCVYFICYRLIELKCIQSINLPAVLDIYMYIYRIIRARP